MTNYKKQVWIFFATVVCSFLLYIAILLCAVHILHLPVLVNAEIWLDNLYKVKDYINAQSGDKQRLIIISGSNSLFGFDSSLIDRHTKYKPINYATHGGLPINYHIDKIIANAQKGDIVIMPLEFAYYTRNAPKEDIWYISNMLVWGNGYKKHISAKGIFLTYFDNSHKKTIEKLTSYNKLKTDKNPIEKMIEIWDKNNPCGGKSAMYDYKGLSPYGDFCTQENEKPYIVKFDYLKENLQVSQFFVDEFKRLEKFAKNNEIKIFLTYPTSAKNELFSINNPKTLASIKNLKAQLAKNGIRIYGDFKDSHFEQQYFFDTKYHLNKQGAILRTQNFIKLLKLLEKSGEI